MNITEKQLLQLIILLQSTLSSGSYNCLCYNIDTRLQLLDDIINQQDSKSFINLSKGE